jgi:hypothetical protein
VDRIPLAQGGLGLKAASPEAVERTFKATNPA